MRERSEAAGQKQANACFCNLIPSAIYINKDAARQRYEATLNSPYHAFRCYTLSNNSETRMLPIYTLLILFSLILVAPAHATTEVFIQQQGNPKVSFSLSNGRYTANELISTDIPVQIRLDKKPVKIEMRTIYQGAIGESGPWIHVPHTLHTNEWMPLPPLQEFSVINENNDMEPKIQWPAQFDCAKTDTELTPDQCARWSRIYKQCALKVENSPCYLYQSEIELKIFYKNEPAPEIIKIDFPGGC